MSRARNVVVLCVVCATVGAAVVGWSTAHGNSSHPVATAAPSLTPAPVRATTNSDNANTTAHTITELEDLPLAQPGAEISVGLPATLRLDNIDDQAIYVSATMSEIQALPIDQATALLSKIPALAGYSMVYEMPVSLAVLGVVTDGGSHVSHHVAGLTAADLGGFTIAPHPGSDPLPVSNTLSDGTCQGSPPTVRAVVGQTVQWCVHAFGKPGDPTPSGGQYQATAGTYQVPVSWASHAFAGTVVIP